MAVRAKFKFILSSKLSREKIIHTLKEGYQSKRRTASPFSPLIADGPTLTPRLCQLFRQPNRRDHAGRICDAFAGDVVSRAVIGRGADERQTERPVYAGVERD